MSRTMLALLAALVAVMLVIAFDSPAAHEQVVEVAERKPRVEVMEAPPSVRAAPLADGPIPDLFAGEAPANMPAPAHGGTPAPAEAPPFGLIGFKEEDGVREAYLLRNGAVLTARAGAMLEQRFRVQSVRGDTVHIKDTRSGAMLRIGYGEQE